MAIAYLLVTGLVCILEVNIQEHVHAGVRHLLAPQELTHRFTCSPKRDSLGSDAILGERSQDLLIRTAAVNALYRTQVDVLAHSVPVAFVQALCQIHLAYHCRQHMTVLQMEVVVRAIEVGRHHCDVVATILQREALTHLQSRNLSDGVRLVGVFQLRSEQRLLLHRLRCHARIDACTAEEEQFLHTVAIALAYHVLLYLQVLIDEVGTIVEVGHDAADMSGSQHNGVRLLLVEELLHCYRIEQVELLVRSAYKISITSAHKIIPDGRAHQTIMSGYINLTVFVQHLI